jgi:hypothetical protein
MLQPKASASQVICNLPNTDTGHPDGTRLNPATSGDIHARVKDSEITHVKTIKVKPRDSTDDTLVRDDNQPKLRLSNPQFTLDNSENTRIKPEATPLLRKPTYRTFLIKQLNLQTRNP